MKNPFSKISKYFCLIVVPLHLASIGVFFYAKDWTLWTPACIIFVYALIGGLGLEIYFHRSVSHNNFKFKSILIESLMLFFGSLAAQGSSLAWVSLHRNHHLHADTDLDYQSPKHGLWSSYIGWTTSSSLKKKINIRLCKDLLRSRLHAFFDTHYYKINWSFHIFFALIFPGIYFTILLPGILMSFHVSSVNNLLGHNLKIGERPNQMNEWSTNVRWAALLSWGISFQNTHHSDPSQINYGIDGGIDPGYYLYLTLKKLMLVNPH